jgi:hypothetical protein
LPVLAPNPIFPAVAEGAAYQEGGSKVGIDQPPLSYQIKELEAEAALRRSEMHELRLDYAHIPAAVRGRGPGETLVAWLSRSRQLEDVALQLVLTGSTASANF